MDWPLTVAPCCRAQPQKNKFEVEVNVHFVLTQHQRSLSSRRHPGGGAHPVVEVALRRLTQRIAPAKETQVGGEREGERVTTPPVRTHRPWCQCYMLTNQGWCVLTPPRLRLEPA